MTDEHKPLTAAEIDVLREMEAKATKGPWEHEYLPEPGNCHTITAPGVPGSFVVGYIQACDDNDAALIAAMRNALPRLLAMLQPPADAAVREAMGLVALSHKTGEKAEQDGYEAHDCSSIDTLLSYARAVQQPRMTSDEFVRWCGNCACGKDEAACDSTATGHDDFDGVKCSGWSPRLTEEQVGVVRRAAVGLESPTLTMRQADDLAAELRAAVPALFGKEG